MKQKRTRRVVRIVVSLVFVAGFGAAATAEPDAEGCKDHPMFTRMNDYYIHECGSSPFDRVEFYTSEEDTVAVEGRRSAIDYIFNQENGSPSDLQVIRNYSNAVKSLGGGSVYEWHTGATLKLVKDGREIWVGIATGNQGSSYTLTVVERSAMVQEVSANDMLAALQKDGFMALYINFDTGKAAGIAADRRSGRRAFEAERGPTLEHRRAHRQRRHSRIQQAPIRAARQGGIGRRRRNGRRGFKAVRGGLGTGPSDSR